MTNTNKLLDVLQKQLCLLQASMDGSTVDDDFDEDDFDDSEVLSSPKALLDDIVESSDISGMYLLGVLDSVRSLSRSPSTTNLHRSKMLSVMKAHKVMVDEHLKALTSLCASIEAKQAKTNVVYLKKE